MQIKLLKKLLLGNPKTQAVLELSASLGLPFHLSGDVPEEIKSHSDSRAQ